MWAQPPKPPNLLPTATASAQIREIRRKLAGTLQGEYNSEEQKRNAAERDKTLDQVKEVVSKFVIAQL